MRCDQFETRLNDVLDRRDDPRRDAALIAHAAGCRECRNLAAGYEALTAGAEVLRNEALRNNPITMPRPAASRDRRTMPWVAVIAPLLATAAAAWFVWSRPAGHADHTAQQTPQAKVAPVLAVVNAPPPIRLQPNVAEAEPDWPVVINLARTTGKAYVGLIHGTAQKLDDALAMATNIPAQDLLQPVIFPEDGLLRRMESQIVPVAGETFDALRQVFESPESQQL